MFQQFPHLLEPLLAELKPRTILEIGSEVGHTTRRLLEFCARNNALLHAIDPIIRFDLAAWQSEFKDRLIFHSGLSLNVLPDLPAFDAAVIDGDHNWYTVFNELRLLKQAAESAGQSFPLVFVHDIGWPYGRRDLYYNPKTIPPEHRQPYARRGIVLGQSELAEQGGLNHNSCNAKHEGGPRNGVLTAAEDFVAASKGSIKLITIPGFHGTGILWPTSFAQSHPTLHALLSSWSLEPRLHQYFEILELNRVRDALELMAKRVQK